MKKALIASSVAVAAIAVAATAVSAEDAAKPTKPTFAEDGTVTVPSFELPPSEYMSEEAVGTLKMRANMPPMKVEVNPDIAARRKMIDAMMAPRVAEMRAAYPVDVEETRIGGVPVRVITPKDGDQDAERVLINVHGGGFIACWDSCSLLESVPVASLGKYKVVSVNYRMGPEAKHPAGVEDTVSVYRELLKSYDPEHIGLYGCSAGGALTAQTAAWLPQHDLPQVGAAGIFGAGAVRFGKGDSAYIAAYADGSFPPPPPPGVEAPDFSRGYFDGVDMDGPVLSPAMHPEVLAQFPPTLIITGTRAMDMSPAIVTNSKLLAADVESRLIVGEGMGHCYIYDARLPEAQAAYRETVDFFREFLN